MSAYAPNVKGAPRGPVVDAHGAIATLHSFRFFGLVFILPGVVGPDLPASFATFAAYGDFATGLQETQQQNDRGLVRHG